MRNALVLCCLASAALGAAPLASAQEFTNGGFEAASLLGWEYDGDAAVLSTDTSATGEPVNPTSGSFMAKIGDDPTGLIIENFIAQTVGPGLDSFSFDWRFTTYDTAPSDDPGFAVIVDYDVVLYVAAPESAPYDSGWQHADFPLDPATSHYVAFYAGNTDNFDLSSWAYVDNVQPSVEAQPPEITSLNPTYGYVGTVVNIYGHDFGPQQGESEVLFAEDVPAEILAWSDTQIVCLVPEGAVPGPVIVVTDAGESNDDQEFFVLTFFGYDHQPDGYGYGCASQEFTDMQQYTCETADDFWVRAECLLTEFSAYGFYSLGHVTPDSYRFVIRSTTEDGKPGEIVWEETVLAGDPNVVDDGTGNFTYVPYSPPRVQPDTQYWFTAQVAMDFATRGQWYWFTANIPDPPDGSENYFRDNGGFGYTEWTEGTIVFGLGPVDCAFRIVGQVAAPVDFFNLWRNWFSTPIVPLDPTPESVLGFDCGGVLIRYDKYLKAPIAYQPPFSTFDLTVGDSYWLWLEFEPDAVSYMGHKPELPFEFKLGRMGWTWVGMPRLEQLGYPDFMPSVQVKYPSDDTGVVRTAQEDYDATPDNWVSWGWSFYDSILQAPKTFAPYAPFGYNVCYPWYGYRAWVKVGSATSEEDPDQVTLIWPPE